MRAAALLLLLSVSACQIGCNACGTCHDYSSPVANCSCDSCGSGRAGSGVVGGSPCGPGGCAPHAYMSEPMEMPAPMPEAAPAAPVMIN
ncbi:hypothetical protein Mal64_10190 [Pseudobythopirellula maris]|uniref:Uncharacterized protein n=1 Tax=Pseudobythopirellula maris TaxID=2527991 RepID=A0A5C5ZU60_9BACT|nr:hypothetical protein [Pseudobythopirellula maris]TWT90625.1 hypothetical protein Mal64_10190 [Pseudobythopirellula maris]